MSTARPPEEQHGFSPTPVYVVSDFEKRDEFDFYKLAGIFARRKIVLFACLMLAILIAVVYLVITRPVFMATAYLLPPHQQDVQQLLVNIKDSDREGIERYSPENVFQNFLTNLASRGLRRKFFDDNELLNHYLADSAGAGNQATEVFEEKFNKDIIIKAEKQNPVYVEVGLSLVDPEKAAEWINGYISFVNDVTVNQLYNAVTADIDAEKEIIRLKLSSMLKTAEHQKQDQLTKLREGLQIAKGIGLDEVSVSRAESDEHVSEIAISTAQMPLYTRGARALEEEIAALESRKSNEPYIQGYRELQERLLFLEGISLNRQSLSSVAVDVAADIPFKPVKPRKVYVLLVAALLGIFLGIIVASLLERRSVKQGSVSG